MLGDVLGFRLFYNSGAAFSLGTGITPVLTAFACVAVVAIVVALRRTDSLWWALALGALLGGATGNLTDRLLRAPGVGRGEVVDFIQIPFSFPIFNIADIAVVTGALSIVLLSVLGVEFTTVTEGGPAGAHVAAGPDTAHEGAGATTVVPRATPDGHPAHDPTAVTQADLAASEAPDVTQGGLTAPDGPGARTEAPGTAAHREPGA